MSERGTLTDRIAGSDSEVTQAAIRALSLHENSEQWVEVVAATAALAAAGARFKNALDAYGASKTKGST